MCGSVKKKRAVPTHIAPTPSFSVKMTYTGVVFPSLPCLARAIWDRKAIKHFPYIGCSIYWCFLTCLSLSENTTVSHGSRVQVSKIENLKLFTPLSLGFHHVKICCLLIRQKLLLVTNITVASALLDQLQRKPCLYLGKYSGFEKMAVFAALVKWICLEIYL